MARWGGLKVGREVKEGEVVAGRAEHTGRKWWGGGGGNERLPFI